MFQFRLIFIFLTLLFCYMTATYR